MIPVQLSPVANHLWQSTLFAGLIAFLTLALRKNRAEVRYWLWLAASVKFLIPFSLLVSAGRALIRLLETHSSPAPVVAVTRTLEQIGVPIGPDSFSMSMRAAPSASYVSPALLVLWAAGTLFLLGRWFKRWSGMRAAVQAARPLPVTAPIPVLSAPTAIEPGVFGVFEPVLLLPQGIAERLTAAQWKAILAHELCHVRRHDNLAAALHMIVETVFWFHPLVWWIGNRMVEERERACDEEVLQQGNPRQAYAEGILNVCKFYVESPLACASGVTGSDLKKRIEGIMTERITHNLTLARKMLLAATGAVAVAGPVLIGIMHTPEGRADSGTTTSTFEVASIKPADPDSRNATMQFVPGGGLNVVNVPLKRVIAFAYGVFSNSQLAGGPEWIESQKFDIRAKGPEGPEASNGPRPSMEEQRKLVQSRLQALLADRFQLVTHREQKEMPVYALVLSKGGLKMKESAGEGPMMIRRNRGEMSAERATLEGLTANLSSMLDRPVVDRTNAKGSYDFTLQWMPEPGEPTGKGGPPLQGPQAAAPPDISGPSIFTALQEQLGLKLESSTAPVEIIVIDRVSQPSAN